MIVTSYDSLQAYADTLMPCVYDDFIGTANKVWITKNENKNSINEWFADDSCSCSNVHQQ